MIEFYNIENFTGTDAGIWNTLLGGFLGAAFSAVVALGIFGLGIWFQRRKEKKAKKADLANQLDHFLYLLKKIIVQKIDTEIRDQNYIKAYNENPMGRPVLKIEIPGDLERILKIDSKNIRLALKMKENNFKIDSEKLLWRLYSTIDFYMSHTEQRPIRLEVISKQRDDLGERLVNSVNQFRVSLTETIIEIKQGKADGDLQHYGELFRPILEDYENHMDPSVSTNMKMHEDLILTPFLKTIKEDEFIEGYFKELYSEAKLLSYLFGRYMANGYDLRDVITQFNDPLKELNETIICVIQTHFDPNFNPNQKEIKNQQ